MFDQNINFLHILSDKIDYCFFLFYIDNIITKIELKKNVSVMNQSFGSQFFCK